MKWGILATGNIAGKFAQTVGKMEKEEQIVAVGSRSLERGKEFAEKYGISTYYASYEELLADRQVEAVYVATPNRLHFEDCKKCLEAGKHVLCEKPLTTKREDSRIKDKRVKQSFVNDDLYDIGKCLIEYQSVKIPIYSRERLLVDLIQFRGRIPFDYYKDVIGNYRRIINDMDFFSMEDYAEKVKGGKKIMDAIQLEVL